MSVHVCASVWMCMYVHGHTHACAPVQVIGGCVCKGHICVHM